LNRDDDQHCGSGQAYAGYFDVRENLFYHGRRVAGVVISANKKAGIPCGIPAFPVRKEDFPFGLN
jgi:hypothetical protein